MKCYIFSRVQTQDIEYLGNIDFSKEFVICADGGYDFARRLGIVPDVWLGDGDSLKSKNIEAKETIKFPPEKDNTDTDLAVELALERGFKEIVILGGIGGRIDHEFSHFCLLKKILENGAKGYLIDSRNEVTMENGPFSVYPGEKKYISFFPFGGDVEGFSVEGLKYKAENVTLKSDMTLAQSNCFEEGGRQAKVSFKSGFLLVIRAND